jgi:hypothetical protein
MRRWYAVFAGRIARLALLGSECALASHTALELVLHFGAFALFKRISATTHDQRDCA